MDFAHTDNGIHCWFFVQTNRGTPWPIDPDAFVVTVINPEKTQVYQPQVKELENQGMFGFDIGPEFLDQPGEYTALVAANDLPLMPMRGTFNVVHEDR